MLYSLLQNSKIRHSREGGKPANQPLVNQDRKFSKNPCIWSRIGCAEARGASISVLFWCASFHSAHPIDYCHARAYWDVTQDLWNYSLRSPFGPPCGRSKRKRFSPAKSMPEWRFGRGSISISFLNEGIGIYFRGSNVRLKPPFCNTLSVSNGKFYFPNQKISNALFVSFW